LSGSRALALGTSPRAKGMVKVTPGEGLFALGGTVLKEAKTMPRQTSPAFLCHFYIVEVILSPPY